VFFAISVDGAPSSQVAMEQSGASAMDLFNGVTTHFLSECPGKPGTYPGEDMALLV